MKDETRENREFRVEDRRASSGAKGAGERKEKGGKPSAEGAGGADDNRGTAPKVDFSTFLLSLLSTALIQLGDLVDPITGKPEKNLDAAGQTIDILDIIRVKTEGNRTEEEDKLLRNATAELKWKYLDALKQKG